MVCNVGILMVKLMTHLVHNVNSKATTPRNKACLPDNKFDGIVTS